MNWWSEAAPAVTQAPRPPEWPVVTLPPVQDCPAAGAPEASNPGEVVQQRIAELVEAEVARHRASWQREGYARGYEAGVAAGQRMLEEARELMAAAERERAETAAWLERALRRLEEEAVRLAAELAEAALGRELEEPGRQALWEARELLAAGEIERLWTSPEAREAVAAGLDAEGRAVDVLADARVPAGDAWAEDEDGYRVAGPGWRWRRLLDALREEVRAHGPAGH
ncbi:MAG: hypothetical protein IRZ18_03410 [Clostridia bacterium]|nr:hypothetical protein [Clostridia bacterium]